MKKTEIALAVAGGHFHRPVRRLWIGMKQHFCEHRFAIEDLLMVNRDSDGDDRVRWDCDKCGKVFHAQCGLDISPRNGPTYRRGLLPNHEITGPSGSGA